MEPIKKISIVMIGVLIVATAVWYSAGLFSGRFDRGSVMGEDVDSDCAVAEESENVENVEEPGTDNEEADPAGLEEDEQAAELEQGQVAGESIDNEESQGDEIVPDDQPEAPAEEEDLPQEDQNEMVDQEENANQEDNAPQEGSQQNAEAECEPEEDQLAGDPEGEDQGGEQSEDQGGEQNEPAEEDAIEEDEPLVAEEEPAEPVPPPPPPRHPDGTLVLDQGIVYIMEGGKKTPAVSNFIYNRLGLDEEALINDSLQDVALSDPSAIGFAGIRFANRDALDSLASVLGIPPFTDAELENAGVILRET